MTTLKSTLKDIIPKSLIPLVLSQVLSLIRTLFFLPDRELFTFVGSSDLLSSIQHILLESYTSPITFLFMMILINLSFSISARTKKFIQHEKQQEFEEMNQIHESTSRTGLNLVRTFLYYTIIFCFYQSIAVWSGFFYSNLLQGETKSLNLQEALTRNEEFPLFQTDSQGGLTEHHDYFEDNFDLSSNRMLKAIEPQLGQFVASISTKGSSAIISQDEKTAFLALENGSLQIIDLTNPKLPKILSTLELSESSNKTLLLSPDEKTLFASDFFSLEVVDVSNRDSPNLIGSHIDSEEPATKYKTSLALCNDGKTLLAASKGLRFFDVSDFKKPQLSTSSVKSSNTSLVMTKDKKTLFVADKTLKIYDVSNPASFVQLPPYKVSGNLYNLALSNDEKTVFGFARDSNPEEDSLYYIDVSNIKNPKELPKLSFSGYADPGFVQAAFPLNKIFVNLQFSSDKTFVFNYPERTKDEELSKAFRGTNFLVQSSKGNLILGIKEKEIIIYQTFFNQRNTKILDQEGTIIHAFDKTYQAKAFCLSSDEKALFVSRMDSSNPELRIYDLSDPQDPKTLSKIPLQKTASSLSISESKRLLYYITDTKTIVFDISDLEAPKEITSYENYPSEAPLFYQDGNLVIRQNYRTSDSLVEIWNLTDVSKRKMFSFITREEKDKNSALLISKNEKNLFIAKQNLEIFDITDAACPIISTTLLSKTVENDYKPSLALSSDGKTIFVVVKDSNVETLKIFSISDVKNPSLLSTMTLPSRKNGEKMLVDPKDKFLYISYADNKGGLIVIDISNVKTPFIMGVNQLQGENTIQQLQLSHDGNLLYSLTTAGRFLIYNILPKYTVYFPRELYGVGKKQESTLHVFKQGADRRYQVMDENYKIVSFYLSKVEVSASGSELVQEANNLPNWIGFNNKKNSFIVEPKSSSDIGKYRLRARISTEVTQKMFEDSNELRMNPTEANDVMTFLKQRGYLDEERYLTWKFSPSDKSLADLPPFYEAETRAKISTVLAKSFYSTVTVIEVGQPLTLQTDNFLAISTPSENTVSVAIKLQGSSETVNAHFLTKSYPSVGTTLTEKKTKLVLEGVLADINNALKEIAIDTKDNQKANAATVTVDDGFNSPLSVEINNVNGLFNINKAPIEYISVQKQIDKVSIVAGEKFRIDLDPLTFLDEHSGALMFTLEPPSSHETLASWISLNETVLSGTPPTKITSFKYDFILKASNEFKLLSVPIMLNVKFSTAYAVKVTLISAGVIIAAIVILCCLNKKYHFVGKKGNQGPTVNEKTYLLEVHEPL